MDAFNIKDAIRTIPDYPEPGVMFRDLTTLLQSPEAFHATNTLLLEHCASLSLDKIVGIEARGFIFGSVLAHGLQRGFIPVRKKGKLPGDVISHDYALEYGTDRIEMHTDSLNAGDRVLLIDDLIATGGTAVATIALLEQLNADIVECCFVVELPELGGRKKLQSMGVEVFSLCTFDGV